MSHIFISYSHKDKEYVRKLHAAMQNEGFDVWIDDRIDYGDQWLKAIEKNLDECDAFIIVMSKNSSESEMVQNEITRARDLEKQIFPLLLEGKNWLVVQSRQFVDVRDGSLPTEKFYKRLESVTPRNKDKVSSQPLILPKPVPWRPSKAILGFSGLIMGIIAISLWAINMPSSSVPTATVSLTSTLRPSMTLPPTLQSPTKLSLTLSKPTPTQTPSAISTRTATPTPTQTLSPTFTPTAITTSDLYTTMVLIPGGIFQWKNGQKNVPAYYIDQHEVTNSQYEQCVKEGACLTPFPPDNDDYEYVQHYSNNRIEQGYRNYPLILASWNMASNYCEWRAKKTGYLTRLPYDYEWEKAARGSLVNQPYPWGDAAPSCNIGSLNGANFSGCGPSIGGKNKGDAFPVMSFVPNRYGVYDMSGNVSEWINYFRSTSSGDERMIMGGSWLDNANGIQVDTTILVTLDMPGESFLNVGFRCVRPVPQN